MRMDGTAERLLRVEDATAPAFRAVLHFLYSNEPLFEHDTLIDQMRCARPVPRCCHVRMRSPCRVGLARWAPRSVCAALCA